MPFIKLSDIEEREMVPGFRARFVHTDRMTCSYWTDRGGSDAPGAQPPARTGDEHHPRPIRDDR